MNHTTINDIDALLPQTQCELCEYPGCRPYAEAIIEQGERIDRCLPGGVDTLAILGKTLGIDAAPMMAEMAQKQKPALLAVIREAECIGCTKCIQACPVDAIIGAGKLMHTVITDACNGCELCVEPCPVDCIDMIEIDALNAEQKTMLAQQSRERFNIRQQRLTRQAQERHNTHHAHKLNANNQQQTLSARKQAIQDAIARAKAKKAGKQT